MVKSTKPANKREEPNRVSTTLDVAALRQIVELLEASEVTRLEWSRGNEKLHIRRGPVASAVESMPLISSAPTRSAEPRPRTTAPRIAPPLGSAPPPPPPEPEKKGHIITSPFVGTFYRSPSPDQPPFAEVGAVIKKGQVLCIIEAMKLMNEIESEVSGKVAEVLVSNNQPVEFGQPLFRIEAV